MKRFRLASCRPGRVLLIASLMFSTLVTSVVGQAMVLHQHGERRAHLHVLGCGDPLSAAAWSSRFGHTKRPQFKLQSASQRVRILAIVTTGSVFLSKPRSTEIDASSLISHHNCSSVLTSELQCPQAFDRPAFFSLSEVDRTASSVIILRTHTLLI